MFKLNDIIMEEEKIINILIFELKVWLIFVEFIGFIILMFIVCVGVINILSSGFNNGVIYGFIMVFFIIVFGDMR